MKLIYRLEETVNLCKKKTVLNLGFVQHRNWRDRLEKDTWVHKKLMDVAEEVIGIDILCDEVEQIRTKFASNDICGDVTRLNEIHLDIKVDVVNCGELIEHLDNPGAMLRGIRRFMTEDSILIITTPNAFREAWVRMAWKGLEGKSFLNKQHVCWYSFHTLRQLLERYGYEEVFYDYYFSNIKAKSPYRPLVTPLQNIVCHFLPGYYPMLALPKEKQTGLFFVAKLGNKRGD